MNSTMRNFLTEMRDTCDLLLNPKVGSVVVYDEDIRNAFEGKEFKSGATTYKFVVNGCNISVESETIDMGSYM